MTTEPGQAPVELGQQAITAAFEAAQARGKEDWFQMSVAVLKNRILDLTNRNFRETEYGVESFAEFLRLFPETIEVDPSTRPPTVRLLAAAGLADGVTPPIPAPQRRGRWSIRPDLWKAAVDYASGARYGWADGSAVVIDATTEQASDLLVLPTLSEEANHIWRSEFVQSLPIPVQDGFARPLTRWRDVAHSTGALPTQLRGQWSAYFKGRVLKHLEEWFLNEGIPVPADLIQSDGPNHEREAGSPTDRLKRVIGRYLDHMTEAELLALPIPISAIQRADRVNG